MRENNRFALFPATVGNPIVYDAPIRFDASMLQNDTPLYGDYLDDSILG